jgi:hypothetical protein
VLSGLIFTKTLHSTQPEIPLLYSKRAHSHDRAQSFFDTCGQPIEKLVAMSFSVLLTNLGLILNATADENSASLEDIAAPSNGFL